VRKRGSGTGKADISMIEPTLGSIWWKLDMTE
jgi:hypothetical protein